MKKLGQKQFESAKRFMKEKAREIDRVQFDYYFEQVPQERVIEELMKFQNANGGFGHALEPDFRLKKSSPMATAMAYQWYIKPLQIPPDHPVVQRSIRYLLDTYNLEEGRWKAVSKEVNQFPHAPWLHFDELNNKPL
ncbi:hypothetical protein ACFO25_00765 [Paenactinomyces guangxiensis]|uniref:Uncharacterized protein n=1 Tax=Paenactinomyces guangxiensis TaxID=1490290 RepID=A0A7W1WT07_9BACL|nr:hypothetical protein [Paenactinomyces guangxiensis]MBA4495296.1 hypothetical protein [Paenactinomyces guangxiensis]MBH8592582.1 hypothetical protein [Paenactinomyces guangxiensis]